MEKLNAAIEWKETELSINSDRDADIGQAIYACVIDNKTGELLERISFVPQTQQEAGKLTWPKYFADTINGQGQQIRAGIKNNNNEFNTEESVDGNKLWKPVGKDIRIFTTSYSLENWIDSGQVIAAENTIPGMTVTLEVIDPRGFNVIHESLKFPMKDNQTQRKLAYELSTLINQQSKFVRAGRKNKTTKRINPHETEDTTRLWIPQDSELTLNFDYTYGGELKVESYAYDALGRVEGNYSYDWDNRDTSGNKKLFSIGSKTFYGLWDSVQRQFNDGTEERVRSNPSTRVQEIAQGIVAEDTGLFKRRSNIFSKCDIRGNPISIKRYISDSTTAYSEIKRDYDGWGDLREETDEMNQKTYYTYDIFGREIKRDLSGASFEKIYSGRTEDAVLIGCSITDSVNTVSLGTQEFDGLLRVKKREVGGRTETYTYADTNLNPSKVTYTDGSTIDYRYIPELSYVLDRVSSIDSKTKILRQQSIAWDKKRGLMVSKQNNDGTRVEFTYSPSGKLIEESNVSFDDLSKRTLKFSWSLLGKELDFTDVLEEKTDYHYDGRGRLVKIDSEKIEVLFSYDIQGNKTQQISRNKLGADETLEISVSYDDFGREHERTISAYKSSNDYKDKKVLYTATVTQDYYVNDQLESRKTKLNTKIIRTEGYVYDKRNRLSNYKCTGDNLPKDSYGKAISEQTFTYDALDNMTECVTKFGNGQNIATFLYENTKDPTQLSKIKHSHKDYPSEITLEYDANGRMTKNEQDATLTYDQLGRLLTVETKVKGDKISIGYDASNRLSSYTREPKSSGVIRRFYYHNNSVMNEVIRSAQDRADYTHVKQDNMSIAVIPDDNKVGGMTFTQVQIATDGQGTFLAEGDKITTYDYTPWGYPSFIRSDGAHSLAATYPGFKGENFNEVTGCYHLGNGYRTYDPILMRFTCPDSLGPLNGGDINPYAYCVNDPINRTDPSGHLSWLAWAGTALGAAGLLFGGIALGIAIAGVVSAGATGAAIAAAKFSIAFALADMTAGALGIASGALEESDPELASRLGIVSSILGIGGVLRGTYGLSRIALQGSKNIINSKNILNANFSAFNRVTSSGRLQSGLGLARKIGSNVGKGTIYVPTSTAGFGGKLSIAQLLANRLGKNVYVADYWRVYQPLTGAAKVASNTGGLVASSVFKLVEDGVISFIYGSADMLFGIYSNT